MPSFRFSVRSFRYLCPLSGFWGSRTTPVFVRTLAPLLSSRSGFWVQEHLPKPPVWELPFANPRVLEVLGHNGFTIGLLQVHWRCFAPFTSAAWPVLHCGRLWSILPARDRRIRKRWHTSGRASLPCAQLVNLAPPSGQRKSLQIASRHPPGGAIAYYPGSYLGRE